MYELRLNAGAIATELPLRVKEQVATVVPLQAAAAPVPPDQPTKLAPERGVAVRVTRLPGVYSAKQVLPQLILGVASELATTPFGVDELIETVGC